VRALAWTLLAVLLVPAGLVAAGLLGNRPPLGAPPGAKVRLVTYLSTRVAETSPQHPFSELRTPGFRASADTLSRVVLQACQRLGWEVARTGPGEVHAVVTTRLWRFRDDVHVRVEPAAGGVVLLHARSASRVGRGDLGANSRHLMDLMKAVRDLLPPDGG
jgi:hypothetical protein